MLDLRSGLAVHARGGDRGSYRTVRGVLASGDDPLDLALAFRDVLGLDAFYLADLDAIAGAAPDLAFLRRAAEAGLRVWLDAGLRDASGLDALTAVGAGTFVAATETLAGPDALAEVVRRLPPGSVVFGLDMRDGRPVVARGSSWRSTDPLDLIDTAGALGVDRFLILDTARVGSGRGVGTLPLVGEILRRAPGAEVAVGGGVSGVGDLVAVGRIGVAVALVGSALHDGRIGAAEVRKRTPPLTNP